MEIEKTPIDDCLIIKPNKLGDERGMFFESFNERLFSNLGIEFEVKQINHSISQRNVLRGMHFQKPPYDQAKYITVLKGEVMDVVIDLRKNSTTYHQVFALNIKDTERKYLYIPKGCAHGFLVLSETAEFFYAVDNFYSKDHESGCRYDDPAFNIDWGKPKEDLIISEKDKIWPYL